MKKTARSVLYYKLDGHAVVPATREEWAELMETPDARIVAQLKLEDVLISTVFLGIDHNFGSGPPVLFETMIFDDAGEEYQERYTSWDAAMEGHARAVAHVLAKGWPKKKETE